MMPDDRLTVVLPLKGRVAYTYRWMRYANRVDFPFKIVIADGGADDEVAEALSDKSKFPRISYEYIRYPFDRTIAEYYSKMSDALSRVESPYVLNADNDDFYVAQGVKRAVEFLESNPDYNSSRGEYFGFRVRPDQVSGLPSGVYGDFLPAGLIYPTLSYEDEFPINRFKAYFSNWTATWYSVQRTEQVKKSFDILKELDFKDIQFSELLPGGLLLLLGKTRCDSYPYYFRQIGTPLSSGSPEVTRLRGDLFQRMLVRTWSEDLWKFVDTLAHAIVKYQKEMDVEQARTVVKEYYGIFLVPALREVVNSAIYKPQTPYAKFENGLLKIRKLVRRIERSLRGASGVTAKPASLDNDASNIIREFLANPPSNTAIRVPPIPE